jgi:hypothetical protein
MATTFNPYGDRNPPAVATFVDNTSNITYKFPFNINSLNWNYNLNTQSFSTLGGRVTQVLSVNITSVQIQGEAGSRQALIKLFEEFKTIQDNQNQLKKNVTFNVPSRNLTFRVWLESFQIGWDPTTTTYPYVITVEVDEVVSNSAIDATAKSALNHLVNNNGGNIGFSSAWTGLSTSDLNYQYQDISTAIANGFVTKNTSQKA